MNLGDEEIVTDDRDPQLEALRDVFLELAGSQADAVEAWQVIICDQGRARAS
jgi:hypothetical protein